MATSAISKISTVCLRSSGMRRGISTSSSPTPEAVPSPHSANHQGAISTTPFAPTSRARSSPSRRRCLCCGQEAVILTGSTAAVTGTPGFSVYSASKAAIHAFAHNWISISRGRHPRQRHCAGQPRPRAGTNSRYRPRRTTRWCEPSRRPRRSVDSPTRTDRKRCAVPRLERERLRHRRRALRRWRLGTNLAPEEPP